MLWKKNVSKRAKAMYACVEKFRVITLLALGHVLRKKENIKEE